LAWAAVRPACHSATRARAAFGSNISGAVAVRSAHIRGTTARLFAGVGIVADSDPSTELAETQLKLQALLAAVVRP